MKKIFTKEFIIGICVAVALVILFCGIEFLKGISLLRPANFYTAYYENVTGLEVAAPVHIDGFKVGQVREINFDYEHPEKPIEVLLALDEELRLPADTKALIESSMLSGASIRLELGKSKNIIPVGGQVLTDKAPDIMAKVTDEMLPKVNGILPKVDTLMLNLNAITGNPALHQSITRLDGITSNLSQASNGINTILGNVNGAIDGVRGTLNGVNGTINGVNSTISGINGTLPGIMGNAYSATSKLDVTMSNLQTLTENIKNMPLDATMENINELTNNLAAFSNELKNNQGTLGMLMRDPQLYNQLNRVTADIDSLINDIQRNPKRYISIKLL